MPLENTGIFQGATDRGPYPPPRPPLSAAAIEFFRNLPLTEPRLQWRTWHHVLSWRHLRMLWNFGVDGRNENNRGALLITLARCIGFTATDVMDIRNSISQGNCIRREEIITRLSWAPWGLVDGPNADFRADDPGGEFDDFLMPTTPKRYEGRLVLFKRLSVHCDDLFEHLLQNGVLSGQSQWNSQQFARAEGIADFQRLLVPTLQDLLHNVLVPPAGWEPIPFVPAMWRFTIDPQRGPIFRKCLKRNFP